MFSTRQKRIVQLIIFMVLLIIANPFDFGNQSAQAVGPGLESLDVTYLVDLTQQGSGQQAVETVSSVAVTAGNWGPAPGDQIVFDPYMRRAIRGAVLDYDEVPESCFDPRGAADPQMCVNAFHSTEVAVRFGPSFFTTPTEEGHIIRTPDDVMSTFIEESGHSWQEYAFETDGKMSGERIRETTIEDAHFWKKGREYQVKMYILNLDGEYLDLSDSQRTALLNAICGSDGYANPLGVEVPGYGPPPEWPAPDQWPTAAPRLSDHMDFCSANLSA